MPRLPSFAFAPMQSTVARAIAGWRYPGEYAFYDWGSDPGDLAELLDEKSWAGRYFAAVTEEGATIGFLQLEPDGDAVEIGLGLRPDLTGHGHGHAFLNACLDFAAGQYPARLFTLAVAAFNRRAIITYERAGFRVIETIMQRTNGGSHSFLKNAAPCSLGRYASCSAIGRVIPNPP